MLKGRRRGRSLVDAAAVDHLENERRLLGALDAEERDQLAALLRKLLMSPPFRELDPAADVLDANAAGAAGGRGRRKGSPVSARARRPERAGRAGPRA